MENKMIDLTKNQIVDPAIECWVWNDDKKHAKKNGTIINRP